MYLLLPLAEKTDALEPSTRLSLHLNIHDNGRGIDAAFLQAGKIGHFGLNGMRERAAGLGGTLIIVSTPTAGTTISLRVPGNVIYLIRPWRPHLWILKAFRRMTR